MGRDKVAGFEQSILAAVAALGDDAYGLTIYNKLCELEDTPNPGSMYVTLDRLDQKGYLASQYALPLPERGGQPKKLYRVTAEGAAALKESFEKSRRRMDAVPNSFWRLVKWPIKFRKYLKSTGEKLS
jgi:DNA-binding PadR family transcriptional regulator